MPLIRHRLSTVALIAAFTVVGLIPICAQARSTTRLSLTTSDTTAKIFRVTSLTGRLTNPKGRPIARARIRMESRPRGGTTWSLVKVANTDSNGKVWWGIRPQNDTDYRMRYFGSLFLFSTASNVQRIVGHHYALKFTDEFNGSSVDTVTTWTSGMIWGNQIWGEDMTFYPEALTESNGNLVITATTRTPDVYDSKSHSSGAIGSFGPGQFSFKYGYVETRTKVPAGAGLWPAVFLLPMNSTSHDEIDIMEFLGREPRVNHMVLHVDVPGGQIEQDWVGPDMTMAYHTHAVEWTPDHVIWYVDGIERFRTPPNSLITHEVMYLVALMAIGSPNPDTNVNWAGPPGVNTVFPSNYYVDYIRVYQH